MVLVVVVVVRRIVEMVNTQCILIRNVLKSRYNFICIIH